MRKEMKDVICLGGDTRRNSDDLGTASIINSTLSSSGQMSPNQSQYQTPRTFNRNLLALSVEAGRKSAEVEYGEFVNIHGVGKLEATARF